MATLPKPEELEALKVQSGLNEPKELHEGKRITEDEAKAQGQELMTNMQQFGALVVHWHVDNCNQLQHVLDADFNNELDPMKPVIEVREPGHKDTNPENGLRPLLTPEEIIAFKHGVRFALDLVQELPFAYTPIDADGKVLAEYASEETLAKQDAEEEQQPANDSGT